MTSSSVYVSDAPHAGRTSAVGAEESVFVVLLFAGLHTAVSILHNESMVAPYVISFAAALALFALNAHRLSDAVIVWFMLLSAFVVVLAMLVSAGQGQFGTHLRASVQLVYSALIGYAAYLGLTAMGRLRVEQVFFGVCLIMLIGIALELAGPLKPLSDWFRDIFNAWYGAYHSDTRDIVEYGGIRPKFFANEPSILGLMYGIATFLWLAAKTSFPPADVLAAAVIVGLGFYLIRSPNVFLGPAAFFWLAFLGDGIGRAVRGFGRVLLGLYFLGVALIPAAVLYATITFANVPHYMKTMSFFERTEAPFLVAGDVLFRSPVWGIGFGDKDQMRQAAIRVFHDMGMLATRPTGFLTDLGRNIGNLFWEYWIHLGVLGGVLFALLIGRMFRLVGVRESGIVILAIAMTTFWQGFGGLNAPIAWFTLFAIGAMFKFREQAEGAVSHVRVA